ncbi:MAG: hypothetical protein JXK93_00675 [Sphaerochaetaceae bacterium]|nr:hypothetical protein [Sphaerochaetaceae bacterium]
METRRISSRSRMFLALVYLVLAIQVSLFAVLAPPAELRLNTVVEPVSEFTFTETSPVTIILGTTQSIGFHYKSNFLTSLKIASEHYGSGSFRLKHTSRNEYIPYTLTFDYGDGLQRAVAQGTIVPLLGFTVQGGYDIYSSLEITSESGESASEGAYYDTITFSVIAQ